MRPANTKQLRRAGTLVMVAAACPAALFGSLLIGCAGHSFTSDCAFTGAIGSQVFLLGAGVLAGLLVAGWSGLAVTLLGVVAGMVTIPLLAQAAGNAVPIDPWQAVIAGLWFMTPITFGYGMGRVIWRFVRRNRRARRSHRR